jgi:hypothetical protein
VASTSPIRPRRSTWHPKPVRPCSRSRIAEQRCRAARLCHRCQRKRCDCHVLRVSVGYRDCSPPVPMWLRRPALVVPRTRGSLDSKEMNSFLSLPVTRRHHVGSHLQGSVRANVDFFGSAHSNMPGGMHR